MIYEEPVVSMLNITLGTDVTLLTRQKLPAGSVLPVIWSGVEGKMKIPFCVCKLGNTQVRIYKNERHTFSHGSTFNET